MIEEVIQVCSDRPKEHKWLRKTMERIIRQAKLEERELTFKLIKECKKSDHFPNGYSVEALDDLENKLLDNPKENV